MSLMNDLEEECGKLGVEVMGGHTQMTDAVSKTLVTITGLGKIDKNKSFGIKQVEGKCDDNSICNERITTYNLGNLKEIKPNYDIVMVKWAGMQGLL